MINIKHLFLSVLSCLAVVACGGGGNSGSGGNNNGGGTTGKVVVGTAATGVAIANATVDARDNAGQTTTTTTDANGAYTLQFSNVITPPVLVRLTPPTGSAASYQVAISNPNDVNQTVVINLTPLVTTATEAALGVLASAVDPTQASNTPSPTQAAAVQTNLNLIINALSDYLLAAGLPTTTNPMTTAFTTGSTGLDTVLDLVQASSVNAGNGGGYNMQLQSTTLSGSANTQILINNGSTSTPPVLAGAPSNNDAALIAKIHTDFKVGLENAFATTSNINGSPLAIMFHDDLLDDGHDKTWILNDIRSDAAIYAGAKVAIVKVENCDFSNTPKTCLTQFELRHPTTNALLGFIDNGQLAYNSTSTNWQYYGNQFAHGFEFTASNSKRIFTTSGMNPAVNAGIEFNFQFNDGSNCTASNGPTANDAVMAAKVTVPTSNTGSVYTFTRGAFSPCSLNFLGSAMGGGAGSNIFMTDTEISDYASYIASSTTRKFVTVQLYDDAQATNLIKTYSFAAEKIMPLTRTAAASSGKFLELNSYSLMSLTYFTNTTTGIITLESNPITAADVSTAGYYLKATGSNSIAASLIDFSDDPLVNKASPSYTFNTGADTIQSWFFETRVYDKSRRQFKVSYGP